MEHDRGAWIDAMVADPILIERPVVIAADGRPVLGRPPGERRRKPSAADFDPHSQPGHVSGSFVIAVALVVIDTDRFWLLKIGAALLGFTFGTLRRPPPLHPRQAGALRPCTSSPATSATLVSSRSVTLVGDIRLQLRRSSRSRATAGTHRIDVEMPVPFLCLGLLARSPLETVLIIAASHSAR